MAQLRPAVHEYRGLQSPIACAEMAYPPAGSCRKVATVLTPAGPQDFALQEIRPRVVTALAKLGLPAEWHNTCDHCG